MKALIVDDDRVLADILAFTLRREGFEVVQAFDGEAALERWQAERPDIVVLDVNLPRIDGFAVCRRIRELSDTPIVLLTVRNEEDDIVRGLELGADDYITKPFSPRQLVARALAVLRRAGMRYDVAEDEAALAMIARVFDEDLFDRAGPGFASDRPLFILGLPRSGTTLVDRIVSAHSSVDSLGEHSSLALAVQRLAGRSTAGEAGPTAGKAELIERSARIDFAELGRQYCRAIDGFGNPAPRLIDKTPLNFLYLGLIRLSLSGARVIHLRRHPLDSCYAIYKTLFRAGYPFSYTLQETGRYYIAYHGLMAHWRKTLPGAFLDVDYEALIADPEGQARRIIDYLGLDWEAGCLQFHRRSGAAATASAAQVRQPIYSTSVGMWRNYARQLAPLARRLREQGIDVDVD